MNSRPRRASSGLCGIMLAASAVSAQMTREGFFDHFRPSSLVFNLRMDPFERHGGQKSNDLAMQMGVAFGGQVQDAVNEHMATFKECKPLQEGGTLRMGGQ